MCGRFNVIDNPGLQQLLRDLGIDLQLPTRVNIAPTDEVPLVRESDDGRVLQGARWWLTPSWAPRVEQKYAMFNARSETLAESRAFRGPFRRQRGIVPMSSFIEWRTKAGHKQPWLVSPAEGAFAAAALWDVWERGEEGIPLLSCSVVTTAAAPAFAPWHARMPVLLAPSEWNRWLDNKQVLTSEDPLFRSELKMTWRLEALSTAINRSANKAPELLEPQGDTVFLEPESA